MHLMWPNSELWLFQWRISKKWIVPNRCDWTRNYDVFQWRTFRKRIISNGFDCAWDYKCCILNSSWITNDRCNIYDIKNSIEVIAIIWFSQSLSDTLTNWGLMQPENGFNPIDMTDFGIVMYMKKMHDHQG